MIDSSKVPTFYLLLILLWPLSAKTQGTGDTLYLLQTVHLDSVVITDTQAGFDINSFIQMVQADTGFYEAFRQVRTVEYISMAQVRMFDKSGLAQASCSNRSRQVQQGDCHFLENVQQQITGDFLDKKGELNYFTARLFSYIFLYQDTVCQQGNSVEPSASKDPLEKRKEQLKVLIFQPGQAVDGIPFVKHKLGIFDDDMQAYYDYSIEAVEWQSIPCYKFSIHKKVETDEDKVILQYMNTWFRRSDFSIIARNYHVKEQNFAFDFDVHMQIQIGLLEGKQVPTYIYYNGNWNAPGKKRERGSVQILINQ